MFSRLFQYNHDINQQLIGFLTENQVDHSQITSWMSHLLNAHHIWLARLNGATSSFAVWQEHESARWAEMNQQAWEKTKQFLETVNDLSLTITYQNSKGASFQNRVDDVLWHVLNHSTHHRGQISTVVRQQGFTPPPMDYIFYRREEL